MINSGKCPKCDATISNVKVEDVIINTGTATNLRGFSYLCPKCETVLSIQMNPLTLNQDLQNNILDSLKQRP